MENARIEKYPVIAIGGSYGYGWQQMWKHFLYLFLIAVIVAFANAPMSMIHESEYVGTPGMIALQILAAAYGLLLLPVIKYGGDLLYLRCMRNEKVEIREMFDGFQKNYLNIILANLLTFAIVGLGIVFLIIPGIILGCRLVFVSYLVMDKNLDPVAAVEKSWEMTRGHGWKIFGMGMLAILVFILGLLCLIVGVFFALIWISTAFASMYHAIDLEDQKKLMNGNGGEHLAPEV
jgi:uncharacterized membrane protein